MLRRALVILTFAFGAIFSVSHGALAAPYAAIVVDARDGSVLHESSADQRLHPASLTKMMTLYLAFEAVTRGRISLDKKVRVSRHAASQVPSKIGLRSGQAVTIRDLIRATAVKSANDAAVALAEALGGSEHDFAAQMTAKARQLGMRNTAFRNASGLTAKGQYSSARDMALLGRALFYDYPQYYNLFGRKQTVAAGRTIRSTNRRLLAEYRGADGIKTGYTNAAGFNLVSSAERNGERIIAVVFGGKSSRSRNAKIAELLNLGFSKAPTRVAVVKPSHSRTAAKTTTVAQSPLPTPRPGSAFAKVEESPTLLAKAGSVLLPSAAQASEAGVIFSAQAPRRSPLPEIRPGSTTSIAAVVPLPRPDSTDGSAQSASLVPAGGWAVQLGVFSKRETAVAELASAALGPFEAASHAGREVSTLKLSNGQAYRARLTGIDRSSAQSICRELKSRGKECLPVAAQPSS
jgi:D-alanyl-D-alanine carboxypeptidase